MWSTGIEHENPEVRGKTTTTLDSLALMGSVGLDIIIDPEKGKLFDFKEIEKTRNKRTKELYVCSAGSQR